MCFCLAVLISKSSKSVSLRLIFGQKWHFLCFKPILSVIFVTIATESYINARLLYLGYSSYKPIKETGEKRLSVFGFRGGQNNLLLHVAL